MFLNFENLFVCKLNNWPVYNLMNLYLLRHKYNCMLFVITLGCNVSIKFNVYPQV